MSNFDIARETLNTAMYESEGSAERELVNYQKSIQYSIDAFKASYQDLSTSIFNSNVIKGFVDGGAGALNFLTDLIDKFGILTTMAPAIGAILGTKGLGVVGYDKTSGKLSLFDMFKGVDKTALNDTTRFLEEVKKVNASEGLGNFRAAEKATEFGMVGDSAIQLANDLKTGKIGIDEFNKEMEKIKTPTSFTSGLKNFGKQILSIGANMAAMTAISLVIKGIQDLLAYEGELAQSAQTHGESYAQTAQNIASYQSEIESLNATISDPTSSIEETTAAREQLLSVQAKMVEQFKNEAGAADLVTQAVNGNSEAYAKLQAAAFESEKAAFMAENGDIGAWFNGYENSWAMLQGRMSNYTSNGNNVYGGMSNELEEYRSVLADTVKESGLLTDLDVGGGKTVSSLEGNAYQIRDTLRELKEEAENALSLDPDNKQWQSVIDNYDKQITEATQVIDQYGELWTADIFNNRVQKNDDLQRYYENLTKAKREYDDAFASGDQSAISEATTAYAQLYNQMESVAKGDADILTFFDNLSSSMESVANQTNFETAFKNNEKNAKKTFDSIAKSLGNLTDKELKDFNEALYDDSVKNAYKDLEAYAEQYGVSIDYLADKMVDLGQIQSASYRELEKLFGAENVAKLSDEDLQFAYDIKNIGDMTFDELEKRIDRLRKIAENEIDIKSRTNLEGYQEAANAGSYRDDYDSYTSAMARAKELYEAGEVGSEEFKAAAKMFSYNGLDGAANFEENYANLGQYFTEGATGLEKFVQKMTKLKDVNKQEFATFDPETDTYDLNLQDIEGLAQQMSMPVEAISVMLQALQQYGFTDTYFGTMEDGAQQYENKLGELMQARQKLAEMEANPGSYTDTAIKEASDDVEQLEKDLTTLTNGMAEMEKQEKQTVDATQDAMDSSIKGLQEQLNELNGLEEGSVTYDKVKEAIEAQIEQLESQYGIELEVDENGILNIVDKFSAVDEKIQSVQQSLEGLKNADGSLNLNDAEVVRLRGELHSAYLEKLNLEAPGIMQVDTSNLIPEVASTVNQMSEILRRAASIEADASIGIDTTVAEAELAELIASLPPEIVTALGFSFEGKTPQEIVAELGSSETVEIPTEFQQPEKLEVSFSGDSIEIKAIVEGKEDVDALKDSIEGLPSDGRTVTVECTVNGEGLQTDVQDAVDKVGNPNVTVNYTNNTTEVEQYAAQEKHSHGVTEWDNNITKVNTWASQTHFSKGSVGWVNDVTKVKTTFFAKGVISWNGSLGSLGNTGLSVGGVNGANGTAHANGTVKRAPRINSARANGSSFAGGNWSIRQNETALTGELGKEILVRGGKWQTIGDNGAEFTSLKKGDIIFNHRQTEALLKNGYVTGRGKPIGFNAHAEGTARFGGSSGGFGNASTTKVTATTAKATTTYQQATTAKAVAKSVSTATKAVTSTAKTVSTATKDFQETLDAVEIRIDRLSDELSRITTSASDVEQRYVTQNNMLNTAIEGYLKMFNESQRYYDRYIAQANASGLSDYYKQLVQSGEIDILKITDESLNEKIQDYKEWYDKAQEVNNLIVETQKNLRDLANTKMENIKDDFDFIVGRLEELINLGEVRIDLKGTLGQTVNESDYLDLISKQGDISRYLTGQYDTMAKELNALIANGSIERYSDDWYDWEQQIASVGSSIVESDQAVQELIDSIRELRWESFNKGIENLDNLNDELSTTADLINDNALFNDKGSLTNQGITKLGLYGQQLSIARKKVVEYNNAMAKLREELSNGIITQSEYNEYLVELKENQQAAVTETNNYRDAIISLVKDGIEKETEAMNKLIETRKKDLQASKEYEDYADQLADKQKEINAKRAQMAAIEGNEKSKSEYEKYQNELKELEDEYNDLKKDHEYESTVAGYDDMLEAYEENQQERLDLLDSNLMAQNQAIADALGVAKDNYNEVFTYLGTLSEVYGQTLSDSMLNPWKDATSAAAEYSAMIDHINAQLNINTSAVNTKEQTIKDINQAYQELLGRDASDADIATLSNKLYTGQATMDEVRSGIMNSQEYKNLHGIVDPQPQTSTPTTSTTQDTSIWNGIAQNNSLKGNSRLNKDVSIYDRIAWNGYKTGFASQRQLFANLGGSGTYRGTASQNSWMVKQLKSRGFAEGGTAKIVRQTGEDGFILGRAGEHIFTPENTARVEELLRITPQLNDIMGAVGNLGNVPVQPQPSGDVNITYDNLIGNIEYVDKNALPALETILEESWKYNVKELKKNGKKLGFR